MTKPPEIFSGGLYYGSSLDYPALMSIPVIV